jgi:hypothetical protein
MRYLTLGEVVELHRAVNEKTGGMAAIVNKWGTVALAPWSNAVVGCRGQPRWPVWAERRSALHKPNNSCQENKKLRYCIAELFCNSAAFVQILALSSAGILTRSIRIGGWRRTSGSAGNAYSWTLDHFQSSGRFTSPRRGGFK